MAHTSSIDRKSLKRPDELTGALRTFFGKLSKKSRELTVGAVVAVACIFAFMLYLNHREGIAERATEALYSARKAQEEEFKALALKQPIKEKADDKKSKDKAAAKPETPPGEPTADQMQAAVRLSLDVEATYPEGVKKLKAVTEEFGGTRSAFEASVALANLYVQHGHPAKAINWFAKAVDNAPSRFEEALALYSQGVALEDTGKAKEALDVYTGALNKGQEPLKGEILMAKARAHEALGQKDQAAATYKRITEELKDTSYSREAELKSARLGS